MLRSFHNKIYQLRKKTWQRFDNPKKESKPVFLVGCGRSGTTLIISQLAKSWAIELFNEHHPSAFIRWRLLDLETIDHLVKRSWARVVLLKPILDTNRSKMFLSRFKDARILFAFRHYYDVINSSMKKFGRENWQDRVDAWLTDDFAEFSISPPPEKTKQRIISLWRSDLTPESAIALYWLFYNSLYYDLDLYQDERVRLIRYESIVTNPKMEFEKICRFLNIDFVPSMAEEIFSSSIGRDNAPSINDEIQRECEALWKKLCQASG